jgi:hypothetical protein
MSGLILTIKFLGNTQLLSACQRGARGKIIGLGDRGGIYISKQTGNAVNCIC